MMYRFLLLILCFEVLFPAGILAQKFDIEAVWGPNFVQLMSPAIVSDIGFATEPFNVATFGVSYTHPVSKHINVQTGARWFRKGVVEDPNRNLNYSFFYDVNIGVVEFPLMIQYALFNSVNGSLAFALGGYLQRHRWGELRINELTPGAPIREAVNRTIDFDAEVGRSDYGVKAEALFRIQAMEFLMGYTMGLKDIEIEYDFDRKYRFSNAYAGVRISLFRNTEDE